MTDSEAAQAIREGAQELQHLAMANLKHTWRARERKFIEQQGRTGYCDCLFYEQGDYVAAYQAALGQL